MTDYTWPSVYFAYFFFALCFVLALFFFIRSWKDGYWSKQGEEVKYQVFWSDLEYPEMPDADRAQTEEQQDASSSTKDK